MAKTVFCVSRGHFWRNCFFSFFFLICHFFPELVKKNWDCEQKTMAGLSKLHFKCPDDIFGQTFSWKLSEVSRHFWSVSKKLSEFCRNFIGKLVKTAFHVSRRYSSWGNYFFQNHELFHWFSDLEHIIFWNFGKKRSTVLVVE